MNIKQSNLMTENVNIQLSDEWWLRKEESDNYWMNKLKTTTLHLNPPAIALPSLFWLRLPVRPRRERNPEWLILTGLSFVNVTKKDCLVSPARLLFGRPKLLWHAFLGLGSWFYKCWRPIYNAGAALFRLKMYLLSCWYCVLQVKLLCPLTWSLKLTIVVQNHALTSKQCIDFQAPHWLSARLKVSPALAL